MTSLESVAKPSALARYTPSEAPVLSVPGSPGVPSSDSPMTVAMEWTAALGHRRKLEPEPYLIGEIVRLAMLMPHFVYSVAVPSAITRAMKTAQSDAPSRLNLLA